MNQTDIILIIILALMFAGAIWIMVSNRKKGKGCHGCSGGCYTSGGCSSCSQKDSSCSAKSSDGS